MSRFDNMQADGLDGRWRGNEVRDMTRTPMLIMLVAAAALAGCNKENHTIVTGGPAEDDTNTVSNAPVALPPSIQATKTYRCADNSVVIVDWMSDGSAHVKKRNGEVPTVIAAGSPDLKGDAKAASVTYKGQSCSA
jgi:hypothetical protein